MPVWGILLIILAAVAAVLIFLYFYGKKLQKRQEESREQIEAMKQPATLLILDKKRLPLNKSGLPQIVIDQAPRLAKRSKLPIVKAKVGPKIVTLIADEKIFDLIPLHKEVKAEVSGIYIVNVKGIRGALEAPTKLKWRDRMRMKFTRSRDKALNQAAKEKKEKAKKK